MLEWGLGEGEKTKTTHSSLEQRQVYHQGVLINSAVDDVVGTEADIRVYRLNDVTRTDIRVYKQI